jgi:hypothetical protein
MFNLWVLVLATSLQHPTGYEALRVHMPYDTRFTCEDAQAYQLDAVAIGDIAARVLDAKHKHITITAVKTSCIRTGPLI